MTKNKSRFLKAVEIIPKDDTYHGNHNLLDIEWWYFDAIFTNGYSIHIGLRTYHIRKSGFIQTRINLYKNGRPLSEKMKMHLFSNLQIAKEKPDIKINNQQIVIFNQKKYEKTGKWEYNVTLSIKNISVDLTFTSTTKGWKIETEKTSWTVPIPKADVKGKIKIQDQQEMVVQGVGYHDHNWDYSPTTVIKNQGWYWGRITGEKLNLTYANTIENKYKNDLIAVINSDEENKFYNIHPDKIFFSAEDFEKQKRKRIPTNFDLKIEKQEGISVDLKMKTQDMQHTKIFIIDYWRYHVLVNGSIKLNSKIENFKDKSQIIEYLRFKS